MSEEEVPPMDLSKTVEISAEEEDKLNNFLKKLNQNIAGDSELEGILGGTVNKWMKEISDKQ